MELLARQWKRIVILGSVLQVRGYQPRPVCSKHWHTLARQWKSGYRSRPGPLNQGKQRWCHTTGMLSLGEMILGEEFFAYSIIFLLSFSSVNEREYNTKIVHKINDFLNLWSTNLYIYFPAKIVSEGHYHFFNDMFFLSQHFFRKYKSTVDTVKMMLWQKCVTFEAGHCWRTSINWLNLFWNHNWFNLSPENSIPWIAQFNYLIISHIASVFC